MDALTVENMRAAMDALFDAPDPPVRLKYFATHAEMSNAAWRGWFARNYPNVELVEVRPIPHG